MKPTKLSGQLPKIEEDWSAPEQDWPNHTVKWMTISVMSEASYVAEFTYGR